MMLPFPSDQWSALQARHPFKPVYNLDRFGFRRHLSSLCGVHPDRRVYCDWMHGWIWWDEGFGFDDFPGPIVSPGQTKIVTSTPEQADVLRRSGHDVVSGGLPFAYIPKTRFLKIPDTLLAFPTHSSDRFRHQIVQVEYLDFLAEQRNLFEIVCVSLFIHDFIPEILDQVRKRGLVPLIGADPSDLNSLWRTRATLDSFSHVSTNAFGSHVAYALASDCKTSVFSPVVVNDPRPRAKYLGLDDRHVIKKQIVQSEYWLRQNFSLLMVSCPEDGLRDSALGRRYVGAPHILEPAKIRGAVGWTVRSSLIGSLRRIRHRVGVVA